MSKLVVSIIFCAAVLIFSANDVSACSCVPQKPVGEVYESESAIFSGKIIGVRRSGKYLRKIIVKVEKSWKGELPKTVAISTTAVGSMCGYNFSVGKRYLIYVSDGDKTTVLSASICSRTKLFSESKDDVKILDGLTANDAVKTKSSPK